MKTIIKIFICLSLIYTPIFANAANVGGWNLSNAVAQGASTVYDASKNVVINGKNYIKDSWVKISPNATQVAKVLRGGAAGYALSIAVEQLLGSVDWVLDPANNQIKYKPKADPQTCSGYQDRSTMQIFCSAQDFVDSHKEKNNWYSAVVTSVNVRGQYADIYFCFKSTDSDSSCITSMGTTTVITGTDDTQEQTLPLPVVASRVISNAENGDTSAQVATTAAAADIVAEAENDEVKARPIANQAEANAETKPADEAEAEKANEAQGQSKPNEANPEATDISLEFPVFCNWAPTVCEAAQVVISFPQTLTGWWESANQKADDWATSISQAYHDFMRDDELPNDDTKVDITDIPTPELQENAISWGAACPADVSIPISMQGVSSTLVFSWSPWCQLLSIIKPAIVASAYIGAAFIVLGLRT